MAGDPARIEIQVNANIHPAIGIRVVVTSPWS
jgi:hypothetical protein